VRLFTRRGYDWSDRYPLITQTALRHRKSTFVMTAKPSYWHLTGSPISIPRKENAEVRLYAFDLLSDDGLDMRDETRASYG